MRTRTKVDMITFAFAVTASLTFVYTSMPDIIKSLLFIIAIGWSMFGREILGR